LTRPEPLVIAAPVPADFVVDGFAAVEGPPFGAD
jgi:hypothetical protein